MRILRPDGVRPATALLHVMLLALVVFILASPTAWADSVATLAVTPISVYFDSAPCIAASVLCQSTNGVDIGQMAIAAANAVGPVSAPMTESGLYTHDLRHWPSTGAAWSTVTAGLGQWGIPGTANVPGMVQATFHPVAAWSSANFSASAIGSISVGAMNLDTGMTDPGFAYATAESLNVINVPEPSTWGMVVSGIALLGWITRRRMNG